MEKDKISVIIPVYNVEKYLDVCIKSVVRQTYKNLEILLINDGSTDQSGKLCDRYAKADSRIQVIHKTNGGLSDARNTGLEIFTGDYVTFVDSDDYISPICIETLYSVVEKHRDVDIVMEEDCSRFIDGRMASLYRGAVKDVKACSYSPKVLLELMLYQKIEDVGVSGKLYKAKLFQKTDIRFPYGVYYEDLAIMHKLLLCSEKIFLVNCKVYAYRMRKDSIMHQKFSEKKLSCISVSRKLFKEIKEEVPELLPAAASRCVSVNRVVYSQVPYRMSKKRKNYGKKF